VIKKLDISSGDTNLRQCKCGRSRTSIWLCIAGASIGDGIESKGQVVAITPPASAYTFLAEWFILVALYSPCPFDTSEMVSQSRGRPTLSLCSHCLWNRDKGTECESHLQVPQPVLTLVLPLRLRLGAISFAPVIYFVVYFVVRACRCW
jgi:hypothetical protein